MSSRPRRGRNEIHAVYLGVRAEAIAHHHGDNSMTTGGHNLRHPLVEGFVISSLCMLIECDAGVYVSIV